MNNLLFLLGSIALGYYIYQERNSFNLEKNAPKIVCVLGIFYVYYMNVSPELFEGLDSCVSKCSTYENKNDCKNPCVWTADKDQAGKEKNTGKCSVKSPDKCNDITDKSKCVNQCMWKVDSSSSGKEKKCGELPKEGKTKCDNGFFTCLLNNCDEKTRCIKNLEKDIVCSKTTKCVPDMKKCPKKCDIDPAITSQCTSKKKQSDCKGNCKWNSSSSKCNVDPAKISACKNKASTNCSSTPCKVKDKCKTSSECEKAKDCKDGCISKPYILNPTNSCKGEKCTSDECCEPIIECPNAASLNTAKYEFLDGVNPTNTYCLYNIKQK